jgi:hypothetical protein
MPLRRSGILSSTGFRAIRARLAGNFVAEIIAASERVWLGTFDSKEEASRAYDATTWWFGLTGRHEFPGR